MEICSVVILCDKTNRCRIAEKIETPFGTIYRVVVTEWKKVEVSSTKEFKANEVKEV